MKPSPTRTIFRWPPSMADIAPSLAVVNAVRGGRKGVRITAYVVQVIDPNTNEAREIGKFPCGRNWRVAQTQANRLRDNHNHTEIR